VDAVLAPERRAFEILMAAANAPSLRDHLLAARRMHPLYERLRAALAAHRRDPAAHLGRSWGEYEGRLLANMARLRALPADPGQRYVLVEVASARLWMYEDGRPIDAMRVVVGKASQRTPTMAGLIRFAVRKPYWNLPPDLTRVRAMQVLREGPRALDRERLEMLSDWTPSARLLDAGEIDWRSVAAGTQKLRMRQLPGPGNMMGEVKFMLPNTLGIYLHDTPDKAVFGRSPRTLSSGCVRLEDAARLGQWLAGGGEAPASEIRDERVDLPAPVPVYIIYLTVMPGASGIVMQDDPYRRDDPAGLRRS
jgi:murein L,D-transpeptidase YcbB/YkuD